MAMNFGSDSTQGSIMVDLDSQSQSAVVLKDSSSNEIVSFTPAKKYINVVVSAPSVVKGGIYTIASGNLSKSVTLDSLIYGESGGMAALPAAMLRVTVPHPVQTANSRAEISRRITAYSRPKNSILRMKTKQETLIQTADLIKSPIRSLMKTEILHSLQKSKNLHKSLKAHRAEKIPRRIKFAGDYTFILGLSVLFRRKSTDTL